MKRLIMTLAAGSMFAGPLAAQDQDTPAAAEQPQMCEMMHNGKRMKGMMMRGEDGTMTCQMMKHGHMGHDQAAQPSATEGPTDATQSDTASQDHSGHKGHTPD